MHQLHMDFRKTEDAKPLFALAENNEDIEIIQEKNFSGDITTIELYISMSINVIMAVFSVIKTLIKRNKISSLKINGDKIEVNNVTQDLVEKIIEQKLLYPSMSQSTDEDGEE